MISDAFFSALFYLNSKFLYTSNIHLDQTPCPIASDLGLQCLLLSRLWTSMHECINCIYVSSFSNKACRYLNFMVTYCINFKKNHGLALLFQDTCICLFFRWKTNIWRGPGQQHSAKRKKHLDNRWWWIMGEYALYNWYLAIYEPCHEKPCLCHMRTTMTHSDQRLFVRCCDSIISILPRSNISRI